MSDEANCNGIKSIEVGARLLAVLTSSLESIPLGELARLSRMSPSKAHRYLTSFSVVGLVEQDSVSREYRLGRFARQMGLAAASRAEPLAIAFQVMRNLVLELNETVFVAVWGAQGATIVRQEVPRKSVVISMPVGYLLPLTRSAAGCVFAAFLPEQVVRPVIAAEERLDCADVNPCRISYWSDGEEGTSKRFDFVASVGSMVGGISAMASPLFDQRGDLVAVLTVMGAESSLDVSPKGATARTLVRAAHDFHRLETAAGAGSPDRGKQSPPKRRGLFDSLAPCDMRMDIATPPR